MRPIGALSRRPITLKTAPMELPHETTQVTFSLHFPNGSALPDLVDGLAAF